MIKGKTIVVVDDEPSIRRILQVAFEREGLRALIAENAEEALALAASESPACVITDVTMPGRSGYELLRDLQAAQPELPVIIMTAFGTIPQAVQAIREGAFEYVTKPFDLDSLKRIVAAAIGDRPARKPRGTHKKQPSDLIAASGPMREVLETVRQVADSRASVLITGESGTGKEVVAKLTHQLSSRASGPFVAVSCAAIPETLLESELFGYEKGAFTGAAGSKVGRFEAAHGGTLFLDEVGEVPAPIQVKLLRVLQEREIERLGSTKPKRIDVRLVAATNRDLNHAVEAGTFRLDLLYRLQVVEIWLPPLRDRTEDILPLAENFLARFCEENGRNVRSVSADAARALAAYAWPGNVRELENAMERAVVMAGPQDTQLELRHLPRALQTAA